MKVPSHDHTHHNKFSPDAGSRVLYRKPGERNPDRFYPAKVLYENKREGGKGPDRLFRIVFRMGWANTGVGIVEKEVRFAELSEWRFIRGTSPVGKTFAKILWGE